MVGSKCNVAIVLLLSLTASSAALAAKNCRYTPAPAPPSNLQASTATASANISWSASSGADISHYVVRRNGSQIASVSNTTLSYLDRSLVPSTQYTYSILAQDSCGKNSVAVAITIKTANPTPTPNPTSTPAPTSIPRPSPLPQAPLPQAFYVAPNGDDNNTGSLSAPFASLGRAQRAMRASRTIKTTFIRAGRYNSMPMVALNPGIAPTHAALMLTSADNGETWSFYPPDGYNTAILNGNSADLCQNASVLDYAIFIEGGSNITIDGLYFENFTFGAIALHGGKDWWGNWFPTGNLGAGAADHNVIKNNIMTNINNGTPATTGICSLAWPPPISQNNDTGGGVAAVGRVTNLTVTHNAILNTQGMGMDFEMFSNADDMSGLTITNNLVHNANRSVHDTGCIHIYNVAGGSTQGTLNGAIIKNNYLHDCGGSYSSSPYGNSRGVYLDDGVSGVQVTGNVVSGHMGACFTYHGGDNNTVSGNICDLGDGLLGRQYIWVYQDDSFCSGAGCMSNNVYQGNIVVSRSSIAMGGNLTFISGSNGLIARNDLSFSYGTGAILDGAAVANQNPGLSGWNYLLATNSPAYSSPVNFPIQPPEWGKAGFWGPPEYTVPQTGTAPSCPH
jgi:hypothetical protein